MDTLQEDRDIKYKFVGDELRYADPPAIQSVRDLLGESYTDEIEWAFPDVAPAIYPCGMFILVQLSFPKKRKLVPGTGKNGIPPKYILFPDEAVTSQQARSQTALVRALGPVAYRNRETMREWPEGSWCRPGKFIRTPMYGGDRIAVAVPGRDPSDEALFVLFRDQDCLSVITGDPLSIKVG